MTKSESIVFFLLDTYTKLEEAMDLALSAETTAKGEGEIFEVDDLVLALLPSSSNCCPGQDGTQPLSRSGWTTAVDQTAPST